jgi:hypothetical protein
MGVYGESAVRAVELIRTGECPDPPAAWERAAEEVCCSASTAAKTGPRCAFLGLCEEGLVAGVPAGTYTTSILNKQYALDAVVYLREAEEKRRAKGGRHGPEMEIPAQPQGAETRETTKTTEKPSSPPSPPSTGHRHVPEPMVLWRHINGRVAHSGQMDVVTALWKEGYIE